MNITIGWGWLIIFLVVGYLARGWEGVFAAMITMSVLFVFIPVALAAIVAIVRLRGKKK